MDEDAGLSAATIAGRCAEMAAVMVTAYLVAALWERYRSRIEDALYYAERETHHVLSSWREQRRLERAVRSQAGVVVWEAMELVRQADQEGSP